MSLYKHHIFVCINEREEGHPTPCCGRRGGVDIHAAMKQEVLARGLKPGIRVNKSGCLSLCAKGPTVVIYPQGTWYVGVTKQDVPEILDALESGTTVERLLLKRNENSS